MMKKVNAAVYKLQPWDMLNGEKYSKEGNLEAHYYHAKNNGGKVLFTTSSGLFRKDSQYVLLTLPQGEKGVLYRVVEKDRYPKMPSNPLFKVPSQWSNLNEKHEQLERYKWIALEVVSDILTNIQGIPSGQSPRYMDIEI